MHKGTKQDKEMKNGEDLQDHLGCHWVADLTA